MVLFGLILLTGCSNTNTNPFTIPEFDDFDKVTQESYTLTERDFKLKVDQCLVVVDLLNHAGNEILLEIGYNNEADLDDLTINFSNDQLQIDKNASSSCLSNRVIAYLKIHLPLDLASVEVISETKRTNTIFTGVNYQYLTYEHTNGNVDIQNGIIDGVEMNIANGKYVVDNTVTKHAVFKLTNGNFEATDFEGNQVEVKGVNGSLSFTRAIIHESAKIGNTNGIIELVDVNETVESKTEFIISTVNGQINLTDVYVDEVTLEVINGNLTYINQQTEKVIKLTYSQINGGNNFQINGEVIKK